MKELSIFIDESGDFGEYDHRSPFYIITMLFHDQNTDVQSAIAKLDTELSYLGLSNICIHTGPIIRKEEIYIHMSIDERRRIFSQKPCRKAAGFLTLAAFAKCTCKHAHLAHCFAGIK